MGDQSRAFFSYSILQRKDPTSTDEWDGNWLVARIQTRAGIGTVNISGSILSVELLELYSQLKLISTGQIDEIYFEPTEPYVQLSVKRKPDGLFHIDAQINAAPLAGEVFIQHFTCTGDAVDTTIKQLEVCILEFPSRNLNEPMIRQIESNFWYREGNQWWVT